jgi:hypothetical protein
MQPGTRHGCAGNGKNVAGTRKWLASTGHAAISEGRMMKRLTLLAAGLAMTFAVPSVALAGIADGKLPDGAYHCEVYLLGLFLNLGDITIKGNVYSGPSYGWPQQAYNYEMNSNGEIAWLGPLGGFTAGGNSVSLTQATADDPENASFDIVMRQPDGAFTASTCTIATRQGE